MKFIWINFAWLVSYHSLLQKEHVVQQPSSLCFTTPPTFQFSPSFIFFLAGVVAISLTIMFLCTTQKNSKMRKARGWQSFLSNISSKALGMVKMVLPKKVQEKDGAVWRKTILKGDKCRPLEFSGQILYDSEGNQMPEPQMRSQECNA